MKTFKDWYRTKKGIAYTIHKSQRLSSKRRGHRPPEYTKEELREWLMSQTIFHELYDEWVQSGYKRRLKPSADRKHDDIHYCMSNIQLMTWGENKDKAEKCHVLGLSHSDHRAVLQFSPKGMFIARYLSIREAQRATGISSGNISKVCKKRYGRKTAGGYKWEYQ